MVTKKGGRPKMASVDKRDKAFLLKFSEKEMRKLKEISDGALNLSEFIRNRLFYNSTLQQVQPEVFIQTLNNLGSEIAANRENISSLLLIIKEQLTTNNADFKGIFDELIAMYKQQLKIEQSIAKYMKQMLRDGRKTGF